jgi:hypothetical protein
MVAVSRSSTFHRFTIHYSEGPVLRRILAAAQYARAEPVWHFARLGERSGFRIDLVVGGLSQGLAEAFATRLKHLPGVSKVMWARNMPVGTPVGAEVESRPALQSAR